MPDLCRPISHHHRVTYFLLYDVPKVCVKLKPLLRFSYMMLLLLSFYQIDTYFNLTLTTTTDKSSIFFLVEVAY